MKKLFYISLVLLMSLGACTDSLDLTPPLQMDNEKALTSYNNIQSAVNAAYAPFYGYDPAGGGIAANWYGRDFLVIADLQGGNAKSSPLNTGRFQTEYNFGNTPSNTTGLWSAAYMAISRANNVLEYVDVFEEPGVTQEMRNQVKGEALFIRALSHFDLVRMYAQPYTLSGGETPGVPIIRLTEIAEPARNTVKEVYEDLIVADLLAAEEIIGDPARGDNPAAFASKEAVQALLAKVYLYMGNWEQASAYASKVIDSGKFSLYTAADYATAWGQNAASEVIFEIHGNNIESNWPGFDEIGYIYYPDGYGDVCATDDLLGLFEAGDVRGSMFQTSSKASGFFWTTKYPGKGDLRVNNIPVLRLSEMYLIRAEAARNGAAGNALADYNAVRANRGLAAATSVTLEDIYDERRRELCFEGNIRFDLARRNAGLTRDAAEHGRLTGDLNIAFPDYRWAMPIPIQEIEANPNCVQNENY